jgi:murein DD-endopeptidase MepM/ murein hydrolase activator NlpD
MNKPRLFLFLFGIILIVGSIWAFLIFFEMEKPSITLNGNVTSLGLQTKINLAVADEKSGIRSVVISILQNNNEYALFSQENPEKGIKENIINIDFNAKALKLHDGEAILRITATDYSLLKNTTSMESKVTIDTIPPLIAPLNSSNYINPGGTGVILYTVSEDVSRTGVQVGETLFAGYPYAISGKPCYIAYFALPLEAGKEGYRISVFAEDKANNKALIGLSNLIRAKKFNADKVNISRTFVEQKMSEFKQIDANLPGTPLEAFLYINEKMRDENFKTIQSVCSKSTPKQLWQGVFLRMKDAAPMASYGQDRTYYFEGMAVSKSIHMGVDLASTEHAPVQAANDGIVVYSGGLGIYGNAVILDHGFGLFSLYAHMSALSAKVGQTVKKGDPIGTSGTTGLASGDHVHFAMLISGHFVNPTEWWDSHWIQDNVEKKLNVTF